MTKAAWGAWGVVAVVSAVGLYAWGKREAWDAELATGVAGLWLGGAGFWIAIAEIRRAATVAEATDRAVQDALDTVAANRLAITVTQMTQAVEQVETARSAEQARKGLNAWRVLAADAHNHVRRRFGEEHDSLPTLRRSMRVVSETKADLYGAPSFKAALRPGLLAMDEVADELGPLLDRLPNIDEEDEDG